MEMKEGHKKILKIFIDTDIGDVSTYGGYRGDHILKITTRHMELASSIAHYCDSIDLECVIKENQNMRNFEVFCIEEDRYKYTLKTK